MQQYHKIYNIFKRNHTTNEIIEGDYYSTEVEFLKDNDWIATEKVDGTNIRIMWDGEKITFGGKTDRANLHKDLISKLEEIFFKHTDLFHEKFGDKKVCLYGEGYGGGIQSGGKYQEHKDFVLFDVLIDDIWLKRSDVFGISTMLEIDIVPIVEISTLEHLVNIVKSGLQSEWGDFISEGIICKPDIELKTRRGERIIIKIKSRDLYQE